MVVRFEFSAPSRPPPDLDQLGITAIEAINLVTAHQRFGFWRSELDTGHVFWSRDIYEIYEMDYSAGPVNLFRANAAVHPDDLPYMLELFERAAADKTGYHYILRLKAAEGYKYVRSVGRYRRTASGREEIFGLFEEFHEQVPMVGIYERK
ncbi:PAS domain-containing protein [Hoeflea marina]|uniref:PAS domain-containing protein n=1 Tax=Hoeflea marina TaxID=274592 RepID=A0A317PIX3_9HYPH|nr:PAS domain-containing protein [Hoeflea marina]PWV97537.1 PAS domain-containing protein [Hoeflea marina]